MDRSEPGYFEYLDDLKCRVVAGDPSATNELRKELDEILPPMIQFWEAFASIVNLAVEELLKWWNEHPELAMMSKQMEQRQEHV